MLLTRPGPLFRAAGLFGFVVACFSFVGCGGGKGDIRGKVTYKGAPLKGGQVAFISSSGGPTFTGDIDENGNYFVANAQSGSYKVTVDTEMLKPRSGGGRPGMGGPGGGGKFGPPAGKGGGSGPPDLLKDAQSGKIKTAPPEKAKVGGPPEGGPQYKSGFDYMAENEKRYVAIPAQYSDPKKTTIEYDAKGGSQTFDIDLK